MSNADKRALSAAFPHSIPILMGFLVLGIAFGTLMYTKGYNAFWSTVMSLVCFCGSMQFVAITLLSTVFDPLQAFLLSVMVNSRHLFYSVSMLGKYRGLGKVKHFLIYTLCDETFSITATVTPPADVEPKRFYFWLHLLNYCYWATGSFLGGIIGSVIPFDTTGLDFVLTGLFVALFLEQMLKKGARTAGLMGVCASILALLLFGADGMVIPAMIFILILLLLGRKTKCI